MNVTITQLPLAGPILGSESVPIVQDGQTRQTTTAAIAASPAQFQTFLTLNQEPTLPNSRRLTAGTGLGLSDGGALSTLALSLNGASGSLETALTGIVVKTGSVTVAARTLTASGLGLNITNGSGVAGNPTFALTGLVSNLANLSGPGLVSSTGTGLNPRVLLGTADEIDVSNGTGAVGNPTVGLADNPIIPGTGGVKLPSGTTAERNPNTNGYLRYNTDLDIFEGYVNGSWQTMVVGGVTFVDGSGGTTGLMVTGGPITTTGTLTLGGTLNAVSGGTGQTSYAAGDMLYADTTTTLTALALGASGDFLVAGPTAPSYVAPSTLTIGAATNVAGGAAGDVPYQTGPGATTFLSLGTSTYIMTAGASAPVWSDPAGITVGNATNAVNATNATNSTNLSGGATGGVPYQTGAGATTFLSLGTSAYIMTAGASAPAWTDPASVSVGNATNAANVGITLDSLTNATNYLAFVDATTGNESVRVNTSITCNPSTGNITGGVAGGSF